MRCGTRRWARAVVLLLTVLVVPGLLPGRAGGAEGTRWTHPAPDGPWSLAADGRGLVATYQLGKVQALDRRGRPRWTTPVPDVTDLPVAVAGGAVAVADTTGVVVLSRTDGARRWSQPVPGWLTALGVGAQVLAAGTDAGTLTVFDLVTGRLRWSTQAEGALWARPALDPGTGTLVAVWNEGGSPRVRAFDAATGALRWEAPVGLFAAAPTLSRGAAVLASGDGRGQAKVEARDLVTGALRWTTAVPNSFDPAAVPAADGHDVVVVDRWGVATRLDAATGRLRWQRATGDVLLDTEVGLTARRVVFRTWSRDVFVLERSTGHVVARWRAKQLGGAVVAAVTTRWAGGPGVALGLRLADPYSVEWRPLP